MPRFDAFCGPTYSLRSTKLDCQRAVNFYCELLESGNGKNERFGLIGTPGKTTFSTLANTPIRAIFAEPGSYPAPDRLFAIGGSKLYEIASDGTATELDDVGSDGKPAKIASNVVWGGHHLFIASNRVGFPYNLSTSTLETPDADVDPFDVVSIATYFVALSSLGIQWSGPLDVTWDPLDFVGPGGVAILSDRKELWVFRNRNMEVYVATSDADVFQPTPSGFIEQGLLGPHSVASIDNVHFGLGGDNRGSGVVWSAEGYKPQRVSNHAVEQAIQGYSVAQLSGARGFAYQQDGHSFYVLNFPAAGATWAYDTTTRLWHERAYWNNGAYEADRAIYHAHAFGKHLVADHTNGKIYELSMSVYDDDGDVIRRLRRSPHITTGERPEKIRCLQVDLESGLGLANGQGSDPELMLRISGDGGKAWSDERTVKAGKIGEHNRRARARRWGAPEDMVLEMTVTDPVMWAIAGLFINP